MSVASSCTVWSYNPAKENTTGLNIINKIVAGVDPPFCHCELQFPNGEACSIVMNGTVRLRQRSFDPEFYTPVVVRAPAAAIASAYQRAQQHVQQKTTFGVSDPRTFCSKLVAEILLESGVVPQTQLPAPHRVSPSTLHSKLLAMNAVVNYPHQPPPISAPSTAISFAQPFATTHRLRLTNSY